MTFNHILSRVLVCDPNPFLADAVCGELEMRGPFATRAGGADLAADIARFRPHVAVLGPACLPGPAGSGSAVRDLLAATLPACALLAYVGPTDRGLARACLADGFVGAVSQEKGIDALIEALTVIRLGGVYVDHDLSPLGERARPAADDEEGGGLSERERSVLEFVARGYSNKEIAGKLSLSAKTVETYRSRGSTKLGVRRKSDIVEFALRHNWLAERPYAV